MRVFMWRGGDEPHLGWPIATGGLYGGNAGDKIVEDLTSAPLHHAKAVPTRVGSGSACCLADPFWARNMATGFGRFYLSH